MKKRVSMLAQFEIFQLFLHDLSCVDVFLCQNSLLAPTNLKKKKTIALMAMVRNVQNNQHRIVVEQRDIAMKNTPIAEA